MSPDNGIGSGAGAATDASRHRTFDLDARVDRLGVRVVAHHLGARHLLLRFHLSERDLLGAADAHDQLHVRRQQFPDCLVQPRVRYDVAAVLEDEFLHRLARNALREWGHTEDPHLRFGCPGQGGDTVLLDPRNVFRPNADGPDQQNVRGSQSHQILRL